MIKLDRFCILLFILSLLLLLVSHKFLKPVDECITVLLLGIAVADSILNKNWRNYTPLWVLMGIVWVYVIYSLTYVHFNTPKYILMDSLIEIKPYVPFFVYLGISPTWTVKDLKTLRVCVIFVSIITTCILLLGPIKAGMFFEHPSFAGLIVYICAISYWFTSINSNGKLSMHDKLLVLAIMTCGLLCTRAKYYGYYVLGVFFLYIYKPGMLKKVTIKHLATITFLIILFVAVAWRKFSYYFITGNSDTFDPNVMESFARPVMYGTSFLILTDYLPFGSGFASFSTYPSAENYSFLYYEYGLDKMHGLSPHMPDFICDAFFPSLAQYGIFGIILFIVFWIYAYNFLRIMIRKNPSKYSNQFSVGVLIISAMLIESVASTTFVQPSGQVAMILLGMICAHGKDLLSTTEIYNNNINSSETKRITI